MDEDRGRWGKVPVTSPLEYAISSRIVGICWWREGREQTREREEEKKYETRAWERRMGWYDEREKWEEEKLNKEEVRGGRDTWGGEPVRVGYLQRHRGDLLVGRGSGAGVMESWWLFRRLPAWETPPNINKKSPYKFSSSPPLHLPSIFSTRDENEGWQEGVGRGRAGRREGRNISFERQRQIYKETCHCEGMIVRTSGATALFPSRSPSTPLQRRCWRVEKSIKSSPRGRRENSADGRKTIPWNISSWRYAFVEHASICCNSMVLNRQAWRGERVNSSQKGATKGQNTWENHS